MPRPTPMLTDRQRTLVRETWAQVIPIAPAAAALFYGRLFEIAPELRALFRHADMDAQGGKLVQVLGFAVAHLDQLDTLAPAVEALGRRHAAYGVHDRDYAPVGEALLWTLAQGLGPSFTAEAHDAWAATFRLIAGIMRSAVVSDGTPDRPAARPIPAAAVRAVGTLAAALLVAIPTARRADAQLIDTRNATPVLTFGVTYGQTFTAPVGATHLERFSFWLSHFGDGGTPDPAIRAVVMAWDGTQAVGAPLYTSPIRAPGPCCSGVVEESFLTPGLAVVGGAQYVAVVTAVRGALLYQRPGDDEYFQVFADTYAGGGAVIIGCPSGTLDDDCFWWPETDDVSFVAEFASTASVVPEPASIVLVATGLAACGVVGRRRRRRGVRAGAP